MVVSKRAIARSLGLYALGVVCVCGILSVTASSGMATSTGGTDVSGYDFKSSFSDNGWTYYPTGSTSKYQSVTNVGYVTYNEEGRIVSFKGRNSDGETLFVEDLTYVGNEVYNEDGEFIGHAYQNGEAPGVEGTTKQEVRTGARIISRLINTRILSIVTPKWGGPDLDTGLKERMTTDKTLATAKRIAPGLADLNYRMDNPVASGVAAGDAADSLGLGVWLSGGMSFMGNSDRARKYDGYSGMIMLGADYQITDRTLLGVAFGVEGSYNETDYYGLDGESGTSGYTIAPYLSVAIFEHTLFNLISGISFVSNADTTTAYYDSMRFMISPSVTQFFILENWLLSGTMSFTYAREDNWSYSSSSSSSLFPLPDVNGANITGRPDDLEIGELRIAGRAAYNFEFLQPYLEIGYIYDIMESQYDADEVEGILGLDIYPTDSFIVSLEASNSFFRTDIYNVSFMANMRYEF